MALVSQAKELLIDGCTGVPKFDISRYHLELLDEKMLNDLINNLKLSVDSFCVSKELDFMEKGFAKVEEGDTEPK